PLVAGGGSGGGNTREAFAAPPTTVLDRPAARRGGRIVVGRVGGSKGFLVRLRGAGGASPVPTGGETGLTDSPGARPPLMKPPRGHARAVAPATARGGA